MLVLELQELKKEILTNLTFQEHQQLCQMELLVFGNVEYESRFAKKSYHREREHLTRYELAPLSYSRGGVNAEAGLKYNVADNFGVKLSYELQDNKNSAVKLGFNAAF